MTLKTEMLLSFLPDGCTNRQALSIQFANRTKYMKNTLSQAIAADLVKPVRRKIKCKPKSYDLEVLLLTVQGLQYLVSHLAKDVPSSYQYLAHLPQPLPSTALSSLYPYNAQSLQSKTHNKIQRAMCQRAGISVSNTNKLIAKSITLHDLIETAKLVERKENNCEAAQPARFTAKYFSSNDIKNIFQCDAGTDYYHQYAYLTHTGIIVTQENALLTYMAGRYGTPWSPKGIVRYTHIAASFARKMGAKMSMGATLDSAILFVRNTHEFRYAITDPHGKNVYSNNKHEVGPPYTHLYVIPCIPKGAGLLKLIMSTNDPIGVANQYVAKTQFNTSSSCEQDMLFSIYDDLPVLNGIVMDACNIQKAYNLHKENNYFGILCYSWQKEFYQAIFPDLKYYLV